MTQLPILHHLPAICIENSDQLLMMPWARFWYPTYIPAFTVAQLIYKEALSSVAHSEA